MTSNININFPPDRVLVSKAQMRTQFDIIRTEIETLQGLLPNVMEFGAKGDDSTDDTEAFRAAIATGKSFFVPPGRYRISGTLTMQTSGQRMVGYGRYACVLRPTGNFNVIVITGNATGVTIVDIGISSPLFGDMTGGTTISVINAHRVLIMDVQIGNCHNAIYVEHCNQFSAHNVYIVGISGEYGFKATATTTTRIDVINLLNINIGSSQKVYKGIWIDGFVNTVQMYSVTVVNSYMGMHYTNSRGPGNKPLFLICHDFEVDFPTKEAMRLDEGDTFWLANIYLQGSSEEAGLYVGPNAPTGMVTNAYIRGNHKEGVVIAAQDWVISNSQIGFNSYPPSNYFGYPAIRVAATARGTRIVGNSIGGTSGTGATSSDGVHIENGATRTVVMGNDIAKVAASPVRDDTPVNSDTIISDNIGMFANIQHGVLTGIRPGFGARATAILSGGAVTGFTIQNGGSGYHNGASVNVICYNAGATGFAGTVNVTNGVVTGITVTNGGVNYAGPTSALISSNFADPTIRAWNKDGSARALILSASGDSRVDVRNDRRIIASFGDTRIQMLQPMSLPALTRSTLPSASSVPGAMARVTDQIGGSMVTVSNGSAWMPISNSYSLRTDLNLYVSPSGNDANDGLSNVSPKLTIQAAWDWIISNVKLCNRTVFINLAPGTYSPPIGQPRVLWAGGILDGRVVLRGNVANPDEVVLVAPNGTCITVPDANIVIQGIRMTCGGITGSDGIVRGICVELGIGANVILNQSTFGAASYSHISNFGGLYNGAGSWYNIAGGAQFHITSSANAVTFVERATIGVIAASNFSGQFISASTGAFVGFTGTNVVNAGSVTGKRWSVFTNAILSTNGAFGANVPGNVAGETSYGGIVV